MTMTMYQDGNDWSSEVEPRESGWAPDSEQIEIMAKRLGYFTDETGNVDQFVAERLDRAAKETEWAGKIGALTMDRTIIHYQELADNDVFMLDEYMAQAVLRRKNQLVQEGMKAHDADELAYIEVSQRVDAYFTALDADVLSEDTK